MSNNQSVTPSASVVDLPTYSGANLLVPRSELLGTPTNAAGVKPLNPFADDAIISNNILLRRPGSSPQPASTTQHDILRRPAVTVDAAIKTTTTTAAGISLTPSKPLSNEIKSNWFNRVSKKHPVKLVNYARLFVFLPLLAYITFESIYGADWRHNEYRFDGNGSSRTLLSLSGVERVVRTGLENQDNAAMLSELAVSYKSVVSSSQCDLDSHIEKANALIGLDKPLDVLRVNSDRNYRLAVFGILYGPTYRDVDCRAIQKFRIVGILVKIFLYFALILILVEWLICLAHFSSDVLIQEAIAAYEFLSKSHKICLKSASVCESQLAPPFLMPATDEWIPIDMANGGGGCYAEGRSSRNTPEIDIPPGIAESQSPFVNKFWWLPLIVILRKFGIYRVEEDGPIVQPAFRFNQLPPTRSIKLTSRFKWLPLFSFLEGSTYLLSILILIMIGASLFVWSHQTNQPACLNAETELETCQNGSTYTLAIIGAVLAAGSVLAHSFAGRLINRLDIPPRPEHKWS